MARLVLNPAQRHLRDKFKLDAWIKRNVERKRVYFGFCHGVLRQLRDVAGGDEPPDEAVIQCVFQMLQQDGTFDDHVLKSRNANMLSTPDGWRDVTLAAAAEIFRQYLVAVENHEWPEGGA